jgi:hypothetical protein
MLKLNHKAMRRTHIGDVLFPGLPIMLDKLLAFGRKVVFPRAVPVGFLFGPGITIPDSPMRPVGDSVCATFGDNLAITTETRPPRFGVGFNTLTTYKCISHVARPHLGSEEIG